MKRFYILFSLFTLMTGTMTAQRIVSVGEQVTDASQLNPSDHYVIKLVSYYNNGTKTEMTEDKYFYTTGGRIMLDALTNNDTSTKNYLVNLRTSSTNTDNVWAVGLGTFYLDSFITGTGGFNQTQTKQDRGYKFEKTDNNAFYMRGYRGTTEGLYLSYNATSNQVEVTSGTTNAMSVNIYKANTNVSEGKFYKLKMRSEGDNNNVVFNNGLYTNTQSANSDATDGIWFFKKDPNSLCRWYMYNAEVGDEYGLTAVTTNNSRATFTKQPTSFSVIDGNDTYKNQNGFALNVNGNATLNDVSGAIGVWNYVNSLTDKGSTFIPTELTDATYARCTFNYTDETNSSIKVVRHTYLKVGDTPTIPSIGYFTASTTSLSHTVSATESENTFTVNGTFNYPFALSASESPKWYAMLVRPGQTDRDVIVNGSSVKSRVNLGTEATTYEHFNDGLFSFIQSGQSENFKVKTRSGKYLQFVSTTKASGSKYVYNEQDLATTTTESEASDFKIMKTPASEAEDKNFILVPVFSHADATYVVGDHHEGVLSVWSGNNGAFNDKGSWFNVKDADTENDILTIGATAKANDMAAAAPSSYVGGLTPTAVETFKAKTFTSLSNIEEEATSLQKNNENLQKPQTDKLYTLRFTRYGVEAPVFSAFKNAEADANGVVKDGEGNTPNERLVGFSTTAGATAIVRFVQTSDGFNVQDVNSQYYYGTYSDNGKVYAVKDAQYAAVFTVENSIDGNLTVVGLKDTKSASDITHQYLFCCGGNQEEATSSYDYLQFHSPYLDNATTGTTSTIEPGCKMQIEELSTFPITISEAAYASMCLPFSVTLPKGITANKVTAVGETNELSLEEVGNTIAANEPVILSGNAGNYNLTVNATSTEATQASDNILTGANVKRTGITDIYYALGYKANGDSEEKTAGFYRVSTSTMPANKAYLLKTNIPTAQQSVAMFSFNFGETTAIEQTKKNDETDSNVYYDLQGRRVLYPAHGILVKANGQKVFVK